MSVKVKILFPLLVLLLFRMITYPSGLKAEKKFRFGTWTYGQGGKEGHAYPTPDSLMKVLANTLKFNYLQDTSKDTARFNAIQKYGLKIASQIYDSTLIHNGPYYYSFTHHKVWEAEGNEGHPAGLNLQHPDNDIIVDGNTVAYRVLAGVDAPGLVQWGPLSGYKQDILFRGSPAKEVYIPYTASYRVKAGPDPNKNFNDTVTVLSVTWGVDTLAVDTLWDSDFPADTMSYYLEQKLTWDTQHFCSEHDICKGQVGPIEYQVYWFGKRDFYIDKVTLYDEDGFRLLNGEVDEEIYTHIREFFKDSSSLDAWYMREELHGSGDDADAIEPWAYIERLLADSSEMGVGSMHYTDHIPYFLDQVKPKVLLIHRYNLNGEYYTKKWGKWIHRSSVSYSSDYSGSDSANLQTAWDNLVTHLDKFNDMCQERGINYIATLQGHSWACTLDNTAGSAFPDTTGWYYFLRPVTGYELECQANLAVAHGAKGVLYWKYWSGHYYPCCPPSGLFYKGADSCETNDTTKWCWIKNKIGPYFEALGETYYNLTWLGAGSSAEVASIDSTFIDSVKSQEYPDSAYIEVAFFKDTAGAVDTNYFMLVNRRCLTEEEQKVTCYIDKGGTYLIVDLCASVDGSCISDTTLAGDIDGTIPFTTHLDPGEGKLFKMVPR
jgi:hypothetical protein